ncbi:hypothetical protein L218DRAFT_565684 [Marasmius fiardii PR-910]|nr:hypothetical protein L218DRAFT_565684 [Marasmius fiardii PR-910]
MAFPSDFAYPRRVVVDDTDPRIKYESGTWTIDNDSFDGITRMGAPYNRTQHGTASSTASFSFQFEGEFVQVRGSKDNRKITRPKGVVVDDSTQLAKWTCSIDGDQIQSGYYYAEIFDVTHNMLCEQSHLSRTLHTLSVNVTLDDPTTQMFWLDKIEYAPLPGANLAQEVIKFDASDPSIQFDNSTGAWISLSDLFNATGTTGASASVNFNALYQFTHSTKVSI